MNSYHDFLKYELENFEGDFPNFVKYIPEFFKLLCDLLEEDIDKEMKRKINSALAYFVLPNDVISEEIYGPAGYIDDVFACCTVLKEIKEKYSIELMKRNWEYDEDFEHVLEVCYNESLEELKEKDLVDQVLKAASLD